jgi:hypothetical protein
MVYVVTTRHQYVPCSMWQRYTHWLTDYSHCTTCFIWWLPYTSVCHAPCDRGIPLTTTLYHLLHMVTTRHQCVPCSMWQRHTDYHIVPLASYGDCHAPVCAMLHVDRGIPLTTTLYHLLHMVTTRHQCVPCSMWQRHHWLPHCTTCFIWWLPCTSVCHAPCDRGTTDYHIVPLASYIPLTTTLYHLLHMVTAMHQCVPCSMWQRHHWLPHCTICFIWWLPHQCVTGIDCHAITS